MRPSWDQWGLAVATAVATRGDCSRPNGKVGCVIVDTHHRIVSAGYTGAAPGQPGCLDGACPRAASDVAPGSDYSNCISLHAEVNAVANGDATRMLGGTAYVTREPCSWCSKVLQAAGVARVEFPPGTSS